MLSQIRTKIVAAAAVVALAVSPVGAETLQWKFKAGESENYAMSVVNNVLIDFSGAEFDVTFGLTFDLSWTVDEVADDGTATLTQKIDRIQVMANTPFTGEFSYDSKEGEEPAGPMWEQMGPIVQAMLDAEIKLKAKPNGEVTEVTLPDELAEALSSGGGRRGGGGGGGGGMGAMMGGAGMFNKATVEESIKQALISLPPGDISADTKWTRSFENPLGPIGVEKYETTYQFEGIESREGKDLHKIVSETSMTFELNEDSDLDLFMEVVEQEGSGTVLFDAAAGRAVESKYVQKIVVEADFMGNELYQERESVTRIVQGNSDQFKDAEAESDTETETEASE